MKRAVIFLLSVFTAINLFGCQPEKEAVKAEEVENEAKGEAMEGLLKEDGIAQVELSKVKGMNPIVYDETDELKIFRDLFSSAVKEPGIVNMSDPEFYLKVVVEDGEKYHFNLWLGGEGNTASLMDTEDTHTIYSLAPQVKTKLIELIGEWNKGEN